MATYSTGTPPTNATKLADLQSVFNVLPDNTSKLIEPKDVRDAVYTLWENITFKPTTAGGTEYIGIDQTTVKQKIFIGKKSVGGQNIMNNTLLSTDVDVFFYNTKTEPQANYHTTVAFLAGTGSNTLSGNLFAPYIKSTVVNNPGYSRTTDFEFRNPTYYDDGTGTFSGGNIVVRSDYGVISLNGINWPTTTENTTGAAYDNRILRYRWIGGQAYARWEESVTASVNSIFSTGSVTITGNPVILNGLPIDFTSTIPVPETIGGVVAGTTFSSMPVTEVLRMILYPYISPTLTTNFTYNLVEIGDQPTRSLQRLNYSIFKNSTYSVSNFSVTPAYTGLLASPGSITNGTTTGQVNPTFDIYQFSSATFSYNNYSWTSQIIENSITVSSIAEFKVVLPWFYGTTTMSQTQSLFIGSLLGTSSTSTPGKLTKLIVQPAVTASNIYNQTLTLSTNSANGYTLNQGYLYFGYPSEYPDLTAIIDPNGFDIFGSWQKFTLTGINSPNTSPTTFWQNRSYKFYIFVGPTGSIPQLTTIGSPPTYSDLYQFKFA